MPRKANTVTELLRQREKPNGERGAAQAPRGGKGRCGGTRNSAPTQGELLLQLAREAEFFHAPDGKAFATMKIGDGHRETAAVRAGGFRNWLSRAYYAKTGKAPSSKNLQDVLGVLEAHARYDGPAMPIYHRVGAAGRALCLDLCDERWGAVVITPEGWNVSASPPVRFRRPRGMLPLPVPKRGGSLADLRPFLNVRDEDWPLAVAWLVQALRDLGPYPILCLHGEQGSAKSTTARVLRSLIDPSRISLRAEPREVRDLAIAASNSWVLALDNLSRIDPWLSDALCRLSTGGGFATRELYTDDGEMIFDFQRPLILNGIEDVVSRADLLDRSLVLHLPRIGEDRRLTESDFTERFERARPLILGALLDALVEALRKLPSTKLDRLPRMADFATWVVAAEPALPWPPGTFLANYGKNREEAVDVALDASPLVQPLRDFLAGKGGQWEGTCQELLDGLNASVGDPTRRNRDWPESPRGLTGRLKRLAPCLRAVGVEVEFQRRTKHGRLLSLRQGTGESGEGGDRHHAHHRHQPGDDQAAAVTVGDCGDGVPHNCSPADESPPDDSNCPFET
jgi:hypothetical protein